MFDKKQLENKKFSANFDLLFSFHYVFIRFCFMQLTQEPFSNLYNLAFIQLVVEIYFMNI